MARWQRATRLLPETGRVLDLACGTSSVARRHDVIGVDASAAFIERTRRDYPHGPFVQASAGSLPFPDAHFAAVLLLDVPEHVRHEQPSPLESPVVARTAEAYRQTLPTRYTAAWHCEDGMSLVALCVPMCVEGHNVDER